ncbi:High-affinity branched-chain amino acid transport ATP-binding protein BraG [Clostridium bornimense]|uniref:High-affinity branched-chain amino acid transport ATP-binding protein BraG n=1 Tax=Clostridium bornimense TaxID=1216932 RepID=W6RZ05_9CLOT|nr:ABC transporter ATP-binding protein [Clostridium bornimense]CDM67262.1 High-affinity branched-chain amino acid transport ATP-binding protein BraG [Clostridium bornimense]
MLKINNLDIFYGGIHALKKINLEVKQGEIVTLIGANGAGKTSTLRALSSLEKPKNGEIIFNGENITGMAPHKLVAKGISHVPEGRKIFANLSVMENLELGAYLRKDKKSIEEDYEMVFEKFPRLKERIKQNAGTLSGGEQQMLAIGRALMNRPKMLLLDEPSMGLAPLVVNDIFDTIVEINKAGTTILLVEQNANKALSIADRAYVLETGRITLQGTADELLHDDKVRAAYLGE